jgi:hypothetical protein
MTYVSLSTDPHSLLYVGVMARHVYRTLPLCPQDCQEMTGIYQRISTSSFSLDFVEWWVAKPRE